MDAVFEPGTERESWDHYFIRMAMQAATRSIDDSTKVGCVLVGPGREVLTTGYNAFPRGVRDVETLPPQGGPEWDFANKQMVHPKPFVRRIADRWARPRKYNFIEHAERNAIYNAARRGVALLGCTAYLNYEPCCCEGCTRALIQVGCVRIVGPSIKFPGVGAGTHYDTEGDAAIMRREAGIEISTIDWGK